MLMLKCPSLSNCNSNLIYKFLYYHVNTPPF